MLDNGAYYSCVVVAYFIEIFKDPHMLDNNSIFYKAALFMILTAICKRVESFECALDVSLILKAMV
jgi:hypothetical protein